MAVQTQAVAYVRTALAPAADELVEEARVHQPRELAVAQRVRQAVDELPLQMTMNSMLTGMDAFANLRRALSDARVRMTLGHGHPSYAARDAKLMPLFARLDRMVNEQTIEDEVLTPALRELGVI